MQDSASKLRVWFGELRRRKVVRVAAVYLVAAWLAIQVAATVFEPLGLPAWSLRLVIVAAALGFPIVCVLAWIFDITAKGIKRTPAAALIAMPAPDSVSDSASDSVPKLLTATTDVAALPAAVNPPAPQLPNAALLALPGGATAKASVAILAFADLSPGHDHDYFCDGIAEEIINALSCVRELRVASRTSSFQFKGRAVDVREIARTLGVDAVVEGSVRKAGNQVRISAQLVSASDGYRLWSETYDHGLEDVFATQTEIAQKLVRALRLSLTPQEAEQLELGGTRNADAYDLYLRGQALLRVGGDSWLPAAALFERAIEADPQFAQAHACLANVLALAATWGLETDTARIEQALAASRQALALEPRLSEAYVANGSLLLVQHKPPKHLQLSKKPSG